MKKCSKCSLDLDDKEFPWKNKSLEKRSTICKKCQRAYKLKHYYENKDYYISKSKKHNAEYKEKVRSVLDEHLKQNPCVDCGEDDIYVLDFDHVEPSLKEYGICNMVSSKRPLEEILNEVKKCQIRCANCHRRRTAKQFGYRGCNKFQ